MLVMQFGIPVALKNIAWKTYIVFCVWCFIQSGILYFLVPETKNRTVSHPGLKLLLLFNAPYLTCFSQLEELDHIFSSASPVKASKERKIYEVDSNDNIIHVDASTASPSRV